MAFGGPVLSQGLTMMTHSYGQGYGHMGRIDPHVLATMAAQSRLGADDLPLYLQANMIGAAWMRERYQLQYYAKAQNLRIELRKQVDAALGGVDVLLTPTTPTVALRLLDRKATESEFLERFGGSFSAVLNTSPLDLTGHPALSVPCGTGEHELPVGLQIIGPRFGEMEVYRAGFAFEAAD
jgi:amidase